MACGMAYFVQNILLYCHKAQQHSALVSKGSGGGGSSCQIENCSKVV